MAQYRSQWTGEVIDDAVGKAKHIEYVIAGVDAQAAFEKVDAAYGIAPVYAVYTTFENFSEIFCRCVGRETPGGQIVYQFEGIDFLQKQWRWTLSKNEFSSEASYVWHGPFTTQLAGHESTSKAVALYENSQTATQNIAKGQYVIWSSRLYTADSDITVGTTLRSAGANKNLTAVPNGGLNDLKSAISPLDGIIVTNASLLQTLASAQLKEHSVTAVRTNEQTTDTPYTGYFIGWAVKYGQNINVQVCDMFSTDTFINSSRDGGTSWYGWTRVAQARDIAGIHVYSNTNTTGATITAGTYFYLYDNLVRAKENIGTDAPFTSGTNYEAVTAGGLNSLNNTIAKLRSTQPSDYLPTTTFEVTQSENYQSVTTAIFLENQEISSRLGIFYFPDNQAYRYCVIKINNNDYAYFGSQTLLGVPPSKICIPFNLKKGDYVRVDLQMQYAGSTSFIASIR